MRNIETVETRIEDTEGNAWEVRFDRYVYYSKDSNYGADADGNRGVCEVFIEEDRAEDLMVMYGETWTDISEVNDEIRTRIEEAVAEWLEKNPADVGV